MARKAQDEALTLTLTLAARRAEEQAKGHGKANRRMIEEDMAAYKRVVMAKQEALRQAATWVGGTTDEERRGKRGWTEQRERSAGGRLGETGGGERVSGIGCDAFAQVLCAPA